jgi:hypothetical protein
MKLTVKQEGYLVTCSDPLETEYYVFETQHEAEIFFRSCVEEHFRNEEITEDDYGSNVDDCVDNWEMRSYTGNQIKISRCDICKATE